MKIVLLETLRIGSDICFDSLKEFGSLIEHEITGTYEEAADRLEDADIVIVDQFPMNENSLYKAKKLKLITMTSTGTNFVDFNYAGKHNIAVANIKDYSTYSVAQHTITLLLYLYEKIQSFNQYVKSGNYVLDSKNASFSIRFHELKGKTWGITGMGRIGRQVAKIAEAFGCNIIYYSPSGRTCDSPYTPVDFDTLLKTSDILSIHTPLTEQTKNLFTYDQFKKMKPSAFLINVARGAIIEEGGLARALTEGIIAGAGLDVCPQSRWIRPVRCFLSWIRKIWLSLPIWAGHPWKPEIKPSKKFIII